jgi:hypothetical protein
MWFDFDRDAHAGGYCWAAFHEGASTYHAAAKSGQLLGVRTAGSGLDVATVPLIAVGNVPCNGSNPPKYLDAEFNTLRVHNASGVWQEAGNGSEIVVAAGQTVRARASVGNTQEAKWLEEKPGQAARFVALVIREKASGRELKCLPLQSSMGSAASKGVPYLGDADFDDFELLTSAAQPVTLSVRMELRSSGPSIPFGEARVFTVKTKAL